FTAHPLRNEIPRYWLENSLHLSLGLQLYNARSRRHYTKRTRLAERVFPPQALVGHKMMTDLWGYFSDCFRNNQVDSNPNTIPTHFLPYRKGRMHLQEKI